MKICFVNPTILVRRPIADLIDQLGSKHSVGLLIPKKPFSKVDQSWHSNKSLRKATIYSYSAVNVPFMNAEWPIPITPMFFIQLWRAYRHYDVVHSWTFFYLSSVLTILTKLFGRSKLIVSCDTFPALSFKSGSLDILFKIYYNTVSKILFRIPNKIHLYGRSMIPFARKAGVPSNKIIVIPTGINLKTFSQAKPYSRKNLSIPEKKFLLIYTGLLIPRKGIDVMIKTIHSLVKQKRNVSLLLVGEGPSKSTYLKMVHALGLTEHITFLGWRNDLPSLLKMADALILPSRGEGLPGIVMEAMAAGIPVVASNIPCIPDLIDDGKTGFLCKEDNVKNFAKKVSHLMNSKVRKKISTNGLKKIRTFSWEKLKKKYLEMYS